MMKRCPNCDRTLDLSAFAIDRSRRDGHMNRCKDCDNERSRAYYVAHRSPRIAAQRPPKDCPDCGTSIPARRRYCDHCRDARRRHRISTPVAAGPAPELYLCHHCDRDHLPGRCRATIHVAQVAAMTVEDIERWISGAEDYIWTPDDWAIHTIATAMDLTGPEATRFHRC